MAVFAVSIDRQATARTLRQELGLTLPILSDPDMAMSRASGMKGEGMMMADMGYVVIDRDGRIRARRINRRFGQDVEDVVELVGQIGSGP